jgi:Domain of unknown function (DUF4349)
MRPFESDDDLGAALRQMRPAPDPRFAADLDARAAAGFPRDSRWGSALAGLRERLTATPPRRLIAPAGALALAAIAISTAVLATGRSGEGTAPERQAIDTGGSPLEGERQAAQGPAQPATEAAPATGAAAGTVSPSSGLSRSVGPYAAGASHRDVERSAEIVLGSDPEQVRADAGKVFAAVHAVGGIVLDSSVRDGGGAGAEFDLMIPSARLGDALAELSRIGEVRSRHEATRDITAPTVRTGERLQDTRARIDGLLGQLAEATTDPERAAVEARLREQRATAARLRSRLSALKRRASFSRVSVRIETGASASEEGGSGPWGFGDGVDGAGRILAVAAGVAVIALAVLAPFALIALLAWLLRRAWVQRSRRAALGRA